MAYGMQGFEVAAEEKNKNDTLSSIIAGFAAPSGSGDDLTTKVNRLRSELKKIIENEETIFGKFRALVDSFREILPDEKQRYHAAVKALAATAKLNRQQVIQAIEGRRAELKILEKNLLSTLPGWRDELKAMDARSQEIKSEAAKLREAARRLESEEQGIQNSKAAREKEIDLVEKTVNKLFTEMGAEIASFKKKVEDFTAEGATGQQAGSVDGNDIFPSGAQDGGRKSEEAGTAVREDSPWQKKCPMCGGRMDFFSQEKIWRCYSCAYEEVKKERQAEERENEAAETPEKEQDTEWQKKCPMCGGRLNFHSQEQTWLCYTCAYEESAQERGRGKINRDGSPEPAALPAADISFDAPQETQKGPQPAGRPLPKKKPCPVCRKKMNWHQKDGAWRCPFCHYERRL
jgi:hypothetical protein